MNDIKYLKWSVVQQWGEFRNQAKRATVHTYVNEPRTVQQRMTVWPLRSFSKHMLAISAALDCMWNWDGGKGLPCMWAWSKWLWIRGMNRRLAVGEQRFKMEWHVCVIWCRFLFSKGLKEWNKRPRPRAIEREHAWARTHIIMPPIPTSIHTRKVQRFQCVRY